MRFKGRLDEYVDDELPENVVPQVEVHIDECVDCAAHVKLLWRMKKALRAAGERASDVEAVDRLKAFTKNLSG